MVELPYKLSRILIHLSLGVIFFFFGGGECFSHVDHMFSISYFGVLLLWLKCKWNQRDESHETCVTNHGGLPKKNIAWLTRNGYRGNPLLEILGLAGYYIYDILKEKLTPNNNTIDKGPIGSLIILHVTQIFVNNYWGLHV